MNLSSLIRQTEQYIFNRYVLYDEFTTILQLIKKKIQVSFLLMILFTLILCIINKKIY